MDSLKTSVYICYDLESMNVDNIADEIATLKRRVQKVFVSDTGQH